MSCNLFPRDAFRQTYRKTALKVAVFFPSAFRWDPVHRISGFGRFPLVKTGMQDVLLLEEVHHGRRAETTRGVFMLRFIFILWSCLALGVLFFRAEAKENPLAGRAWLKWSENHIRPPPRRPSEITLAWSRSSIGYSVQMAKSRWPNWTLELDVPRVWDASLHGG